MAGTKCELVHLGAACLEPIWDPECNQQRDSMVHVAHTSKSLGRSVQNSG
jgi:hypothetical protein